MLRKIFQQPTTGKICLNSVPNWMVGTWKRNWIKDGSGLDDTTKVIYLQTNSKYVDVRFSNILEYNSNTDISSYSIDYLIELSNILCDSGICMVKSKKLKKNTKLYGHSIIPDSDRYPTAKWKSITNYQLKNEYPEPGILTKHETDNNKIYEIPPSNEYLELWEYQPNSRGFFICMSLLEEHCLVSNQIIRNKGCIIIIGEHILYVRDRYIHFDSLLSKLKISNDKKLSDIIMEYKHDPSIIKACMDVEYSYGTLIPSFNDNQLSFKIELSTLPYKINTEINILDHNFFVDNKDMGIYIENDHSNKLARKWKIDTIGVNDKHQLWYKNEFLKQKKVDNF